MKATEQTIKQIERFINKIAQKFPADENTSVLTDIHVRVLQETGEMLAFNDEDTEITRCVVEQWIDNKEENFYDSVANLLQKQLNKQSKTAGNLGIMRPYSFVLENEDGENIGELYLADDETIIISGDLLEGLDKDLDDFFDKLMKD